MKKNIIYFVLSLSILTFGTSSCSFNMDSSNSTDQEQTGKEYTSTYICPMHCEGSGSDKEGDCPVCGMSYEKNDNQ